MANKRVKKKKIAITADTFHLCKDSKRSAQVVTEIWKVPSLHDIKSPLVSKKKCHDTNSMCCHFLGKGRPCFQATWAKTNTEQNNYFLGVGPANPMLWGTTVGCCGWRGWQRGQGSAQVAWGQWGHPLVWQRLGVSPKQGLSWGLGAYRRAAPQQSPYFISVTIACGMPGMEPAWHFLV